MRVFLTGGAGFIGTHTAVSLLRSGHDVIIADNFCNSKPVAVRRAEEVAGKPITLYPIDVCKHEPLRELFHTEKAKGGLDAVIHFAGLKSVRESTEIPVAYYRNNLDSTLTLLEIMKEFDVSRIIFSSSATVYTATAPMPVTETSPTGHCACPYGSTKLFIEQILTDAAKADPSLCAVLLRYFNPVGADPSGLIGEDPFGIPNNLMPNILNAASGRAPELKIFGDDYPTPDGTGVRDYLHVCDLADGHVAALNFSMQTTGRHVFNLGTGNGVSVKQMVEAFERATGVPVPHSYYPRRAGDIPTCYGDASLALEKLGWKTRYTLEDMCRDAWNWQQKNPQGYE